MEQKAYVMQIFRRAMIILLAYYALCAFATTICHADQKRMIVRDPIEFAEAIVKVHQQFRASIQNNFTDSECEDQEELLRKRIEYILLSHEIELIGGDAETRQALEETFHALMALELELAREEEDALSIKTLLQEGLEYSN